MLVFTKNVKVQERSKEIKGLYKMQELIVTATIKATLYKLMKSKKN